MFIKSDLALILSTEQATPDLTLQCSGHKCYICSRENKGTERDSECVGWDMSIPQKLFINWLLNGSLFPETSA